MTGAYIQEKLRPNHCFGCGLDNPYGLQIHSVWEGDEVVCRWTPKDYMTGPPNFLYGGISASLIDCHSVNAAVAYANRQAGHDDVFDPELNISCEVRLAPFSHLFNHFFRGLTTKTT